MSNDPYALCPCGSGKKLKWCCSKVAPYVEKAQRAMEDEQFSHALQHVENGLAKDPKNLWLRRVQVELLLVEERIAEGEQALAAILDEKPDYVPALRLAIGRHIGAGETEQAMECLQRIAETGPDPSELASIAMTVARAQKAVSTVRLISFAAAAAADEQLAQEAMAMVSQLSQRLDLWSTGITEILPCPGELAEYEDRWEKASNDAARLCWRRAASGFGDIYAASDNSAALWNRANCLAWLGKTEEAANQLVEYSAIEGDTFRAIDGVALATFLDPRPSAEELEIFEIRLEVKDHSLFAQRLADSRRVAHSQSREEESAEILVLDKPQIEGSGATVEDIPLALGSMDIGEESIGLVSTADEIDQMVRVIREIGGDCVGVQLSRERVGTTPVSVFRTSRLGVLPRDNNDPGEMARLQQAFRRHVHENVWVDTPFGWLEQKTPRQAAGESHLATILRALVLTREEDWDKEAGDSALALRETLGMAQEPTFEPPEDQVLNDFSFTMLLRLNIDALTDAQTNTAFELASTCGLLGTAERLAQRITGRLGEDSGELVAAYLNLIRGNVQRGNRAAAEKWLSEARLKATNAPPKFWDVEDFAIRVPFEGPETWVPRLQTLMSQLSDNSSELASRRLSDMLRSMGLVQLVASPTEPDRVMLDTRMLNALFARFGRGGTGGIDLSPDPGGEGGIWTPDSPLTNPAPDPGQEKPKIWTPGS